MRRPLDTECWKQLKGELGSQQPISSGNLDQTGLVSPFAIVSGLFRQALGAFKAPEETHFATTYDPAITFKDKKELLDFFKIDPDTLKRNAPAVFPTSALEGEGKHTFPQVGVLWEPSMDGIVHKNRLLIEVGAGFDMISLEFSPLDEDIESSSDNPRYQLDWVNVYNANNLTEVEPNHGVCDETVLQELLETTRDTALAIRRQDSATATQTMTSKLSSLNDALEQIRTSDIAPAPA